MSNKTVYLTLTDAYSILSDANKNILLTCESNEEKISQLRKYQAAALELGKYEYMSTIQFNKIFKKIFPDSVNEEVNNKEKVKKTR